MAPWPLEIVVGTKAAEVVGRPASGIRHWGRLDERIVVPNRVWVGLGDARNHRFTSKI